MPLHRPSQRKLQVQVDLSVVELVLPSAAPVLVAAVAAGVEVDDSMLMLPCIRSEMFCSTVSIFFEMASTGVTA